MLIPLMLRPNRCSNIEFNLMDYSKRILYNQVCSNSLPSVLLITLSVNRNYEFNLSNGNNSPYSQVTRIQLLVDNKLSYCYLSQLPQLLHLV